MNLPIEKDSEIPDAKENQDDEKMSASKDIPGEIIIMICHDILHVYSVRFLSCG